MNIKFKVFDRIRRSPNEKARLAKIVPHHHTGHLLDNAHTSYASLVFIALICGFILGMVTRTAGASPPPIADNIVVSANISAAAPVIITPANGQHFTSSPITVSGSCGAGLVVEVFRNNSLAGATDCQSDNHFSLKINLVSGRNDLFAQHYRPGPVSPNSNTASVFYDKPISGQQGYVPKEAFILTPDFGYQGAKVGEELQWSIDVHGGQPPYAISWDWGDSTIDLFSWAQEGGYSAKHIYRKPGHYVITIKAKDSAGESAYLELVVVVRGSGGAVATVQNAFNNQPPLILMWLFYLLLIIALSSFWVGERYEFWYLKHHIDKLNPPQFGT